MNHKREFYKGFGYTEKEIDDLLPSEFAPYPGDYAKEFYDIKLKDGTIYEYCYPNAGKFMVLDGKNNKSVLCEDVAEFRLTKKEDPFK